MLRRFVLSYAMHQHLATSRMKSHQSSYFYWTISDEPTKCPITHQELLSGLSIYLTVLYMIGWSKEKWKCHNIV